ncbi:MAG: acetyl ornithine aminotransferase family protein [Acidobacteriota bacterium]
MNYPMIKTRLPGPKAKEIINWDQKYVSSSYTRDYPLVAHKGKGALVEDPDGNVFLDFAAGIAVTSTGHCHPRVVRAIKRQASQLLHMSGTDFYYRPQAELAEMLANLAPGKLQKKVFFGNSGAEAIEAAMKLSRFFTRRTRFIAFFGAFHGRTFGALSLTASKVIQKRSYYPLVPGVHHVPYAYCYRCVYGQKPETCDVECVKFIREALFTKMVPAEEVAAIFVEPIQGEGGYVVPPQKFHKELKKLAEENNILYVADEVQSGMGRTGKMFAIEHYGVEPDIIALAKGIASGLPLGVIVAPAKIMHWEPGAHASTFGGNPVSCTAAVETIKLLTERLMRNATVVGEFMMERLREMEKTHLLIGDVRGKGLMIGVEFVRNRTTKERAKKERGEIVQACFKRGLLVLGCGENSLRFCPPLVVNKEEATRALTLFEEALAEVEKKHHVGR